MSNADTRFSKIYKAGTSYGIIIPRAIVNAHNIERGDYVVFAVYGDRQFCVRILTDKELRELKPPQIQI